VHSVSDAKLSGIASCGWLFLFEAKGESDCFQQGGNVFLPWNFIRFSLYHLWVSLNVEAYVLPAWEVLIVHTQTALILFHDTPRVLYKKYD
jgi:hypothetical protein